MPPVTRRPKRSPRTMADTPTNSSPATSKSSSSHTASAKPEEAKIRLRLRPRTRLRAKNTDPDSPSVSASKRGDAGSAGAGAAAAVASSRSHTTKRKRLRPRRAQIRHDSDTEDERVEKRRRQNRESAARCRQRRLNRLEELREQVNQLKAHNAHLVVALKQADRRVAELSRLVMSSASTAMPPATQHAPPFHWAMLRGAQQPLPSVPNMLNVMLSQPLAGVAAQPPQLRTNMEARAAGSAPKAGVGGLPSSFVPASLVVPPPTAAFAWRNRGPVGASPAAAAVFSRAAATSSAAARGQRTPTNG